MYKRFRLTVCLLIVLGSFFSGLVLTKNFVYARAEVNNVVTQKALLQGVSYCYSSGAVKDSVSSLNSFNNFAEDLVKNSSPYSNGDYVALPSGLTLVMDNNLDCQNLFDGWSNVSWDKFQGVFPLFGKKYKGFSSDNDSKEKRDFLENMGYTKQETSGNCIAFEYEDKYVSMTNAKSYTVKAYTKNVCVKGGVFELQNYGSNTTLAPIEFTLSSDKKKITKLYTKYKDGGGIFSSGAIDVSVDISASSSNWKTQLKTAVSTDFENFISESGDTLDGQFKFSREVINGEGDTYYKIVDSAGYSNKFNAAANKAINYISGGKYKDRGDIRFSEAEQVSYYIQVIKEWFYDGRTDYDEYWVCNKSDWSVYGSFTLEVKRSSDGNQGVCRIDPSKVKRSDKAYGFESTSVESGNSGEKYRAFDASGATKLTLEEVVAKINELSDDVSDSDMPGASTTDDEDEGKVDPTCANSGGAGSLGWIVCPILDWMQSAAEGTYNSYVKPNLEVQSDLFGENNGSNPTQDAWTIFQGFANVCFIILFLVVIFSQLTGVGIDNYGIKKLLPKLIVVAVLVNLSYLICLLCVDLSNILGNAFQSLFNGLGVDVSEVTFTDHNGTAHAIGATTITAVALVGVLLLTGYAIWQNPALLLTLLVGVLGVLISIFFLFVLLAARKAAIVVLTVVSPVAFVCYLLPNTKKLFDRWLQLWKAMLLLYPICGLLIGGGDFVSRLLLVTLNTGEGEDFFGTFTAMIVGIIPIFFIPTVLKSAFAAMGTIGSKIAGFGTNARGAATKWMRNREEYKGLQERGAERRARIRAGVDREGRERDLNGFQRAIRGGRKGLSRSRMQYAKNLEGRNREEDITTGTGFAASLASAEARADTQRVADYESLLMNGKVAGVNANDAKSVGQYHAASLAEYQKAQSEADRAAAMAKIKAAQNILSKTDKGRAQVQNNLEQAVRSGQTGGLSQAASHLLGEYGDKYKSVNRGEHAMIADLATASVGADGNITSEATGAIQGKLDRLDSNGNVVMGGSGAYSMAGTSKYTEESLAGADDAALDKLVQSVENGSLTGVGLADLKGTATRALEKAQSGNLNIKPEVRSKLQRIRDYEPPLAGGPSNPPASSPKPVTAPGSAEEGRTFEVPRENRPTGNTGNKNDVQVNPGEGDDQGTWD